MVKCCVHECDQIYLVYGVVKQRRIVVRDEDQQLYSIPETYDKKFVLTKKKQRSIVTLLRCIRFYRATRITRKHGIV